MKYLSFILLLTLNITSLYAEDICTDRFFAIQKTTIQTGVFNSTGNCFIFIKQTYPQNLVYRSHIFSSDGGHLIFNSFGYGPSETDTGARVFFHFPRTSEMKYEILNDEIILTLRNGSIIVFDTFTSMITRSVGLDIVESSVVKPGNLGGVEVLDSDKPWIDFGFSLGNSPLSNMKSSHTINLDGKICDSLNNNLLFKKDGEVYWKYNTDSELLSYLNQCL